MNRKARVMRAFSLNTHWQLSALKKKYETLEGSRARKSTI